MRVQGSLFDNSSLKIQQPWVWKGNINSIFRESMYSDLQITEQDSHTTRVPGLIVLHFLPRVGILLGLTPIFGL